MSDSRPRIRENGGRVALKIPLLPDTNITEATLEGIKSPVFQANLEHVAHYRQTQIETGNVIEFAITDKLKAHKIQINVTAANTAKKVVICLHSSKHHVALTLQENDPLLQFLKQADPNTPYDVISLDYPGNGLNKSEELSDFSKVVTRDDVAAVVDLIKNLIAEQQIQPENIYLIAHSYGAYLALASKFHLRECYSLMHMILINGPNDNLIQDNVTKYVAERDQEKALQWLREDGVLPDVALDVMLRSDGVCERSFAFQVKIDKTLEKIEHRIISNFMNHASLQDRAFELKVHPDVKNPEADPHYERYDGLQLSLINLPVDFYVLLAAIIMQKPLKLKFNYCFDNIKNKNGFCLRKNARMDEEGADYCVIPKSLANKTIADTDSVFVVPCYKPLINIMEKLIFYCLELEAEACASDLGGNYKRGKGKSTDWDARQKMQMAVNMLTLLSHENGPDAVALQALEKDNSFKQGGGNLYSKILSETLVMLKQFKSYSKYLLVDWELLADKFNRAIQQLSQKEIKHYATTSVMYPIVKKKKLQEDDSPINTPSKSSNY